MFMCCALQESKRMRAKGIFLQDLKNYKLETESSKAYDQKITLASIDTAIASYKGHYGVSKKTPLK